MLVMHQWPADHTSAAFTCCFLSSFHIKTKKSQHQITAQANGRLFGDNSFDSGIGDQGNAAVKPHPGLIHQAGSSISSISD
ncbi:hypothetical protein AAHA92_25287 [Salvia divinorum]|uniref:Uncharacterized protein n=1 Tax=Salvia divinorum TaxID=28513 RepID=A0ABD1GCS3_SALDI